MIPYIYKYIYIGRNMYRYSYSNRNVYNKMQGSKLHKAEKSSVPGCFENNTLRIIFSLTL